jgi:hypothetical protein
MPLPSPYLSIVLVARNDNYSGDFNDRLQNSIHWLTRLVEQNQLPAELVIVDYNPVAENEPLIKMLDWPKNRNHLDIRLLHVPAETHNQLINPEVRKTVPLFEFNAKNMAIRRAKGEYILSTNADILFHPSIIKFITKRIPNRKRYYRTDRFDYKKIDSYDFTQTRDTLRKIQRKVFRIMIKGYGYHLKGNGENFFEESIIRLKNSWRLFFDINLVKIETLAKKWRMNITYDAFAQKYHTHCSGDFMLMHRDNWFNLRGYPEDTYISTHCDAIFTVMAGISGLKETILSWPIYHQDHERRYKADFDESRYEKDITDMFTRFLNDSREMEALRKPKISNPADWGHANEHFAETII